MMDFHLLVEQCAPEVAPQTMMALIKSESGFYPWAINVNKAKLARPPQSRDEAVITAKFYIGQGYSVDMGLVQINSKNLGRLRLTVEQVFDPCTNVTAAQTILKDDYLRARRSGQDEKRALISALSAFNTGHFQRGVNNGYVQKVVQNAGVRFQAQTIKPIPLKTGTAPVAQLRPQMEKTAQAQRPAQAVIFAGPSADQPPMIKSILVY